MFLETIFTGILSVHIFILKKKRDKIANKSNLENLIRELKFSKLNFHIKIAIQYFLLKKKKKNEKKKIVIF